LGVSKPPSLAEHARALNSPLSSHSHSPNRSQIGLMAWGQAPLRRCWAKSGYRSDIDRLDSLVDPRQHRRTSGRARRSRALRLLLRRKYAPRARLVFNLDIIGICPLIGADRKRRAAIGMTRTAHYGHWMVTSIFSTASSPHERSDTRDHRK
jgi:hypothetical protein